MGTRNFAEYNPGAAELGRKNQPGGYPGLDENGDLVGTIVNRSMTYDELMDGVVPEVGELVYCSDTLDLHIGDGVTVGGRFHSAPSIPRTLQNVAVPITSSTNVTLCDLPVKANCIYAMRAIFYFTDAAATNNWIFRLPVGKNNLIVITSPMHGVINSQLPVMSARWGTYPLTQQRMLECARYTGLTNSRLSAASDDAVPSAGLPRIVEMTATLMSASDTTLALTLAQIVTDALAITLLADLNSISTQRIA